MNPPVDVVEPEVTKLPVITALPVYGNVIAPATLRAKDAVNEVEE